MVTELPKRAADRKERFDPRFVKLRIDVWREIWAHPRRLKEDPRWS